LVLKVYIYFFPVSSFVGVPLAGAGCLIVSSVFPCQSLFLHYSIVDYHRPLRCAIALERQHIITSMVSKLWASSL
jgi:hypothetical protein